MADTKISALPSGSSAVSLTNEFPIAAAGANFKLTLQDVLNLIGPATTTFPNVPYTFPQFAATTASIASLTTSTNLTINSTLTANSSTGSASQILASRGPGLSPQWVNPFPVGGIIMWSGLVSAIPTGWYLCDGTNGTPDLRNKFIIGAYQDSVVSALNRPTTTLTGLVGTITNGGSYTPATSMSGIISASGRGYAQNTYYNVSLTGGTGTGAKATIVVSYYGIVSTVVITTPGTGYLAGDVLSANYASIGGSASSNTFLYTVTSVSTTYTNVNLTGGTGTGAKATILVTAGAVTSVTITDSGSGYVVGDVLSSSSIGTGSGFQFTVTAIGTYTGGTKDAVVPEHNHSITDPGHTHNFVNSHYGNNYIMGVYDGIYVNGGFNGGGNGWYKWDAYNTNNNTGITVNNAGVSATNQNLPPYFALAFIMKAAY